MDIPYSFSEDQIAVIDHSVLLAEEMVINHYKFSTNQWARLNYDIKTLANLSPGEIVQGPFAQIVKYAGQRKNTELGSNAYDFYKICIQDHAILSALETSSDLQLLPFSLYIITHELIHIVRFTQFLQHFDASPDEKFQEEKRVHEKTHEILMSVRLPGLHHIFKFYNQWRREFDGLKNIQKNHLRNLTTPNF